MQNLTHPRSAPRVSRPGHRPEIVVRQWADVIGVSVRVGYDSPSQFSREYRRQFGAPPSQDAARPRGTLPV